MIGPFGAQSADGAGRSGEINAWVSRAFEVDEEVTVMELRCHEPGCPPVETGITVLDGVGSPRQCKLHKPMAEVTFEDFERLAAGEGEKEPTDSQEKEG